MPDQADQLRELVRETLVLAGGSPAGYVALAGSSVGVGVTTLATSVAQQLASLGARTLIVDANLARPALGSRLGVAASAALHAVLAGRRRLTEATVPAPFGAAVICAKPDPPDQPPQGESLERLVRELRAAAERFDAILVDVGAELTPWGDRICRSSSEILLAGSVRPDDVRSAYALVKSFGGRHRVRLALRGSWEAAGAVARKIGETALQYAGVDPLVHPPAVLVPGNDKAAQAERRTACRLLAAELLAPMRIAHQRRPRTSRDPGRRLAAAREVDPHPADDAPTLSWRP